MTRPSRGAAAPAAIGVVLGVIGLAVVACFAIFLPKAHDDGGESSTAASAAPAVDAHEPLTLPDRLPGGYIASDLPEAFAGSTFDAQKAAISALEAKNRAYADGVLSAVLDEAVATRVYAGPSAQTRLSVQAFRADGRAFAPADLADPGSASSGQTVTSFLRENGGACEVTAAPATSATTGPLTNSTASLSTVTCQKSRDGVTVQLTAQGIEMADIATLMNAVVKDLTAS